jgi:hypothetical protein
VIVCSQSVSHAVLGEEQATEEAEEAEQAQEEAAAAAAAGGGAAAEAAGAEGAAGERSTSLLEQHPLLPSMVTPSSLSEQPTDLHFMWQLVGALEARLLVLSRQVRAVREPLESC